LFPNGKLSVIKAGCELFYALQNLRQIILKRNKGVACCLLKMALSSITGSGDEAEREAVIKTELEKEIFGGSDDDDSSLEDVNGGDGTVDDEVMEGDEPLEQEADEQMGSPVDEEEYKSPSEQEEEDEELIQSKSRSPRKRSSRKEQKAEDPTAAGSSDKILEARREFDEAMEKIKTKTNRRGGKAGAFEAKGQPVDLDDIAESFVKRMGKAADMDCDSVEAGRPALEKQKMLAEVVDMLTKYGCVFYGFISRIVGGISMRFCWTTICWEPGGAG